MNKDLVDIVMNIHQFNQDLTNYKIKQAETIEEQKQEIERLNNLINKVIKYIKEHCIDDEFYINLSNKEKGIIDVLTILENGSDKE